MSVILQQTGHRWIGSPVVGEVSAPRAGDALLMQEARLLYALLDAAAVDDLISDPDLAAAWSAAQRHGTNSHYEAGVTEFMVILLELERRGRLEQSWIGARWRAVRRRMLAPHD